MKIAVVGCSHGALDTIYSTIRRRDSDARKTSDPTPVDLLLCCGDFQAMRNGADLKTMDAPAKYCRLEDFHNYYAGRKKAPVLTIVIGGNHEASSHMCELSHGGWLAPNIYYLGAAGCVFVDGWLRIAGISGIYAQGDYLKGHFERLPYAGKVIKSVIHQRSFDAHRLSLLINHGPRISLFLSHDWREGIDEHGDLQELCSRHKAAASWRRSGPNQRFGSPPLMVLMKDLKPNQWCAGHMHVKFQACVKHHSGARGQSKSGAEQQETAFLALGKPAMGHEFLEVLNIAPPPTHRASATTSTTPALTYDPHWLAIVRATVQYQSITPKPSALPPPAVLKPLLTASYAWVLQHIGEGKRVDEVQKFVHTAQPTNNNEGMERPGESREPRRYRNPQTKAFCDMLGIENKVDQ